MRFYIGLDWADAEHAVWVEDENATKIVGRIVPHTAEGLSEWGRWLDERRAEGIELWAAIEKPEGRIVAEPDAIHVLNAPSPAATASLAIGRHIAELAAETFSLG